MKRSSIAPVVSYYSFTNTQKYLSQVLNAGIEEGSSAQIANMMFCSTQLDK